MCAPSVTAVEVPTTEGFGSSPGVRVLVDLDDLELLARLRWSQEWATSARTHAKGAGRDRGRDDVESTDLRSVIVRKDAGPPLFHGARTVEGT
jgi:hypothetical protein